MKISCQSCQSKYNVADEKVQGKVVKIRCRKCGATIVVDGNAPQTANGSVVPTPGGMGGGAEAAADGQWHVNVSETDQRSMSLADLVDAYNSSVVTQETFIWTDGMEDWRALGEVEVVVAALHAAASAGGGGAPAEEAQYGQSGGEREDAPTQAFSYDQAAAAGYDLPFDGHAAQAAAAPAPAPEPRRAAVVKPRGRDLFGEGAAPADEVQTSAPSMAQAQSMARGAAAAHEAAGAGNTGERNENSVLFSLAALTKNSGPADVPPPPAGSKDDSGLIDLKALALKTQSSRPVAPKADSDLFSAPLGFTPPPLGSPLGALGSPLGSEAEPKSKLPLFIGGGVGVLVLMVLSVVVTLKLAGGATPAPSASIAALPPAPSVSATAEATPSATAEASAAASASAAATAAAKPKPAGGGGAVHAGGGGGAPKPAGGGGGGAATPAATAAAPAQTAAPKKASGCEAACAGDLMCLMKCSTH
jgi:predicted Zn finger-like uncharacterized protein